MILSHWKSRASHGKTLRLLSPIADTRSNNRKERRLTRARKPATRINTSDENGGGHGGLPFLRASPSPPCPIPGVQPATLCRAKPATSPHRSTGARVCADGDVHQSPAPRACDAITPCGANRYRVCTNGYPPLRPRSAVRGCTRAWGWPARRKTMRARALRRAIHGRRVAVGYGLQGATPGVTGGHVARVVDVQAGVVADETQRDLTRGIARENACSL